MLCAELVSLNLSVRNQEPLQWEHRYRAVLGWANLGHSPQRRNRHSSSPQCSKRPSARRFSKYTEHATELECMAARLRARLPARLSAGESPAAGLRRFPRRGEDKDGVCQSTTIPGTEAWRNGTTALAASCTRVTSLPQSLICFSVASRTAPMTASGASPSKCEADAVSTSRQEGGENEARRHEIGSGANEAKEPA